MSYVFAKNDVGLLRQDGTTKIGMQLARDRYDNPIYQVHDDEYLAQQQTQTPGYNGLPYEKEMRLGQDDWRSGFGLETYDSSDPKRYFSSINMDLRFRGMGICGPKSTGITIPAHTANLINGDMETAASGWTGGAQSGVVFYGGAKSWLLAAVGTAYQDVDYVRSCQYSFTCWVLSDAPNQARIGLADGVAATSYSAFHTGGGAWEQLTATITTNVAASQLRVILDYAAGAGNAYWDDAVVTIVTSLEKYPVAFAEFNDLLYIACHHTLYKLNATGDGLTRIKMMPAAITDIEAFTDDKLYIAIGASQNYWYISTAEAFTETDSKAYFFCKVGVTMWKALLPRSIYSATNPVLDANWSGATTVDTSAKNITDMVSFNNALYIMKEDRPFYLSGATVTTLTNTTRPIGNTTSGKGVTEWLAHLFMPWGDQALLDYDLVDGGFNWLNPSDYVTNEGNFEGRVQAVAADETYLFAIVDNGTKNEVLAGRWETIDGSTSWVWHPLHELTLTPTSSGVEAMFVSNVYQKRLWLASTNSADSLYYIALPTGYGDITNDANKNFLTGGYFITPWLHGEFKGDTKSFIKIALTMSGTSDTVYFTVEYQLKGSANWTEVNPATKFKTSPTTTGYIPVDDVSSAKPASTFIRFKITAVTGATTSTPTLYGYDCRAILYAPRRRIITCEVRGADNMTGKDGIELDNSAADIQTAILEASADATWPVTFYDIDGTTKYVRFLPSSPLSQVVRNEKTRNLERRFYLKMQEVTLS